VQAGLPPNDRVPPVGADDEPAADLLFGAAALDAYADDTAVLVHEVPHSDTALDLEARELRRFGNQHLEQRRLADNPRRQFDLRLGGTQRGQQSRFVPDGYFLHLCRGKGSDLSAEAHLAQCVDAAGLESFAAEDAREIVMLLKEPNAEAAAGQQVSERYAGRACAAYENRLRRHFRRLMIHLMPLLRKNRAETRSAPTGCWTELPGTRRLALAWFVP